MKKIILIFILFSNLFVFSNIKANPIEAQMWLENEINKIIELYRSEDVNIHTKLDSIESAINSSFAGTGIARFIIGEVWSKSEEETRERFVVLFKEHLYLTIGSLMQGYSNQSFEFINSKKDKSKSVYLIDMEIEHNNQKTQITWRVKESKNKFYVIDLLVADISLVVTKRAEFISMLKKVDNDLNQLNDLLSNQNITSYENLTKK